MATEPVRISVAEDDLRRSRASVFFRIVLAIPHFIVLGALASVSLLLLPCLWIATLVTGVPPAGITGYFKSLIRYALHVNAYVFLVTGTFPPFLGSTESYTIDVTFPETPRQGRWGVAFRIVLALPALLFASSLDGGSTASLGNGVGFGFGVLTTVGFLAWFAGVFRARLPLGMRDLAVYALGFSAQALAYVCLLTDRYPDASPGAYPGTELPDHPVTLSAVGDDLRRSRLTTFFRLPLAVPHLIVLLLWGVVTLLVAIVAWLAALVTGRVPQPLHRFLTAYLRYSIHVNAFLMLVANPFPGFTGAAGSYPVMELEIGPREKQGRWTILFRGLLAVPAVTIGSALGNMQILTAVFGWWVVMFTGRMPRGLRNASAFALRYSAQLNAYALLLTPRYPYSGPGPGPGGRARPPAAWMARPEAP